MVLNIVVPMAGRGSRFANAGFKDPKPLIPVFGRPMIELVSNNLRPGTDHKFIYVAQESHIREYGLAEKLCAISPGAEVVGIDGVSGGAAETVLAAKHLINNSDPLMIANSDQFVDFDMDAYLAEMEKSDLDGLIMTMTADDPKWSFVGIDSKGFVEEVREKEVISNEATVGIYNFAHGSDFVRAAEEMVKLNMRSNGEFYVAPVYNILIAQGHTIGFCNVGSEGLGMFGLGIPEDLELFISSRGAEF